MGENNKIIGMYFIFGFFQMFLLYFILKFLCHSNNAESLMHLPWLIQGPLFINMAYNKGLKNKGR